MDPSTGQQEALEVKVLRTRPRPRTGTGGTPAADVASAEMSPPSTPSSPANELLPVGTRTATLLEQPQVRQGGREGGRRNGRIAWVSGGTEVWRDKWREVRLQTSSHFQW